MDVIQSLFRAYLTDAQWFAAAHAIIGLLVLVTLINFARWRFDDEPTPTIWQQFDIRTNFVHGLIGLFLIIGISGTFLGLWDVASNLRPSSELTAGSPTESAQRANETVALLLRGIAKAFPVGFVGLLLTFAANLLAGGIEAIKRRRIEAYMDKVGDPLTSKLVETLGPVANLGKTLEVGLKPVIDSLERTLRPIPVIMASQRDELANAKTALTEAALALKESGEQISESVMGLKEMAKTSRAALESAKSLSTGITKYFASITQKLDHATDRATHAFDTYDGAIAKMTESVYTAADSFRKFPSELREEVTTAIVDGYNKSSEVRETALTDLYAVARRHFQENLVNAASGAMHDLERVRDRFDSLGSSVDQSIANAQNVLENYREAWQEEAVRLREDIVKQIDPGIRTEMRESAENALAELERAARSAEALAQSTKKTTADIERMYRESTESVTRATNQLAKSLTSISHGIEDSAWRLGSIGADSARRRPSGRMHRFGSQVMNVLRRPIRFPWAKRR